MYRVLGALVVIGAFGLASLPASAADTAAGPHPVNSGRALGMVPSHGQGNAIAGSTPAAGRNSNLLYHTGGSVQTGTHYTYALYWNPWGATDDANYQTLVNGYFSNVAAASGATSNVYAVDKQYYQTLGGTTTYVTYAESFTGGGADTTTPSSSGCSSTAGGTRGCVSDSQMEQEVLNYIHAHNLPEGLSHEYFVFLGNGVSTCYGSSCFVSQFCAYHSSFTDSSTGQTVLYANMPYTGYNLSACSDNQFPNNDPAADSVINVTSHEANETITDPLGNAWYDRSGNEIGDKCAWNFGAVQGTNGSEYNQVINGHNYLLQQEWSNASSGCALHM